MTRLLIGLGIFLIAWGGFVLVTGDFVATLDIAASLIASGIGVIALANVARVLEKLAAQLTERPTERLGEQPAAPPRPVERPRLPPQADPVPPEARRRDVSPDVGPPRRDPPEPQRRPSEPAITPEPPRRSEAPAGEPAPALVREGVIEGQRFRFYSDGSIEAEGPRGIRRYRSIDEAREQIMRDREQQNAAPPSGRNEGGQSAPPPNRRPEEPRPPRMLAEANENASAPRVPKPDQDLTWDAYLAGGRKGPPPETARPAEDDEWSEPFRMLLKGDAAAADPKTPKR